MLGDKHVLYIDKDAYTLQSGVVCIDEEFSLSIIYIIINILIVAREPQARYHITGRDKFYYKLGETTRLYPSPGCTDVTYTPLTTLPSSISYVKGVFTIEPQKTCEMFVITTEVTSNSISKKFTFFVDCEDCYTGYDMNNPTEYRTRVNIKTDGSEIIAKLYQNDLNSYMKDVILTPTLTGLCFGGQRVILEYERYNIFVIFYFIENQEF